MYKPWDSLALSDEYLRINELCMEFKAVIVVSVRKGCFPGYLSHAEAPGGVGSEKKMLSFDFHA